MAHDLLFPFSQGPFPHIYRLRFHSNHAHILLEEDRTIEANIIFPYTIFLPQNVPSNSCLLIGHGFNESHELKLIPWARELCLRLELPVILFPLAFHVHRRPEVWRRLMLSVFRRRKAICGNRCASPFNAVMSERISQRPERFFLGGLQSLRDHQRLARSISEGTFRLDQGGIRPFLPGTRIHLLGYSISGYLFLTLLLMGRGAPPWGRLLLFSSCSTGSEMDPVSVLVVDGEAFHRAADFYTERLEKNGSSHLKKLFWETEEGFWFRALFLDGEEKRRLHDSLHALSGRIRIIVDPDDPIFPLSGIRRNLPEVPLREISLGRHEFPFNLETLEGLSFRQVRDIIRRSDRVSPKYEKAFAEFLLEATTFFREAEGQRL